MTVRLSQRLDALAPSATVAITQRAAELRAAGVDILSFSVGEPDFPTPAHIAEAAKRAIDEGHTRYTAARGVLALREAICNSSEARRGVKHSPTEVVVSVGAKHSLFNLALALYESGDEVIVPTPYWVSYPEQVKLAGATPVIVETAPESGWKLTPAQLRAAVTDRTKALLLCTPSNPTGSAYTADELRALADVAAEGSYLIIVDEIYAQLVYDGFRAASILEVAPELRDRIVIVDGVSKTFAMTGWRIGWMLAPEPIARACDKLQGQATTNPSSVAQQAAIAALEGPWEPMETMRRAFEKRRSLVVAGLDAIDGLRCPSPDGAFYVFPDVRELLGARADGESLADDIALVNYLLEEARVALVPGSAFGAPGFVRMSYAASEAQLREGIARISAAVAKLR